MSGLRTTNINKETNVKGLNKRQAALELRKKHEPLFLKEGLKRDARFIPRMCYRKNGELVIGFYESELSPGTDIYTEFWSRKYEPEDPNRTLWKWCYNPEYGMEYAQSDPHPSTGDRMYLIPADELINLDELYKEPEPPVEVEEEKEVAPEPEEKVYLKDTPSAGEDIPYAAMTLRDHAAIKWKRPVSHKKWLNDLITKNFPSYE